MSMRFFDFFVSWDALELFLKSMLAVLGILQAWALVVVGLKTCLAGLFGNCRDVRFVAGVSLYSYVKSMARLFRYIVGLLLWWFVMVIIDDWSSEVGFVIGSLSGLGILLKFCSAVYGGWKDDVVSYRRLANWECGLAFVAVTDIVLYGTCLACSLMLFISLYAIL